MRALSEDCYRFGASEPFGFTGKSLRQGFAPPLKRDTCKHEFPFSLCRTLRVPTGNVRGANAKARTASGSIFCEQKHQEKHPRQAEVFFLVNHVDSTWNTFLPYLSTFSEKLETLGFRYDSEQVTIVKEEFAQGKRRFDQ